MPTWNGIDDIKDQVFAAVTGRIYILNLSSSEYSVKCIWDVVT